MANQALNTIDANWASAQHNYRVANLAWSAVDLEDPCAARGRAAENLAAARHLLFATPAPDVGGVIEKLTIWYGESLWDRTFEGSQVRRAIGDLRRLGLEALSADEDEMARSSEETAELAEQWRSAVAEHRNLETLLIEGPSRRWEGRDANEIIDDLANAGETLLELPAPTLKGVVHKLNLLWEVDRFETAEAGASCQFMIWDLNRLSRTAPSMDAEQK